MILVTILVVASLVGGLILGFWMGQRFHSKYIAPKSLEEASHQVAEALLKKEGYQILKAEPQREKITPFRVLLILGVLSFLLLMWLLSHSGWIR